MVAWFDLGVGSGTCWIGGLLVVGVMLVYAAVYDRCMHGGMSWNHDLLCAINVIRSGLVYGVLLKECYLKYCSRWCGDQF